MLFSSCKGGRHAGTSACPPPCLPASLSPSSLTLAEALQEGFVHGLCHHDVGVLCSRQEGAGGARCARMRSCKQGARGAADAPCPALRLQYDSPAYSSPNSRSEKVSWPSADACITGVTRTATAPASAASAAPATASSLTEAPLREETERCCGQWGYRRVGRASALATVYCAKSAAGQSTRQRTADAKGRSPPWA